MRVPVSAFFIQMLFAMATWAQTGTPALQCIANAGVPPTVRVEGLTELVGDVVLQCTRGPGAVPTPLGQPVPMVNITVRYNAPLTNAHLPDGPSDALLLIDEPNTQGTLPTIPPINFAPTPVPPAQ